MRPGGGALAQRAGAHGRVGGERVVVASQHQGTFFLQPGHASQHGLRVGAIAHQIAEKHQALDPLRVGVCQAGLQRLQIGVDVGKQGNAHGHLWCTA